MTVHPGLVLIVGALVVAVAPAFARTATLVATSLGALLAAAMLAGEGSLWTYEAAGYTLDLLHVDALGRLFALIFTLVTVLGVIFALHVKRASEHAAVLAYAGGAVGVALAGDWISAFVFWELMGAASLIVIWHGTSPRAGPAGFRYLFFHALGGSLFFAGLVLHVAAGGDTSLAAWGATWRAGWSLPAALILAGVAVNAAIPPLHAWLPDAYPEASVTGTVFLSAFTTKTAVYLLIRAFPGSSLLLWAGVAMTIYGVVYAMMENDIRRLLAYHIVSQVGYMVAGAGMGTALALNGAAAHAFCHILYKALLLMGAGAVLASTGRRKLSDLGGLAARMPLVAALYMVAALSIAGAPLFNGFVSKSVVVSAAGEGGWPGAELLLTLASVGTFLSTGLKLPYFTFFGPDRGIETVPLPRNMLVGMTLAAALCIGLGVAPGVLYAALPFEPFAYHPYTVDHVVSSLQLLAGTAAGFWLLRRVLGPVAATSLDVDRLYRRPLRGLFDALVAGSAAAGEAMRGWGVAVSIRLAQAAARTDTGNPRDADVYRAPVGVIVLWVLAALVGLAAFGALP